MRHTLIFLLTVLALSLFGQACDDTTPASSDGDELDGDMSDGDEPDGDMTDGDEPDGDMTDGDEPDGDVSDGDRVDGDRVDGDELDGDELDGDIPDGDMSDGDVSDGDTTDGDGDGDTTDGDMSDGDVTEGDVSDGDIEPEQDAGCADNDDCDALDYCSLESCDATSGSCDVRPTTCSEIYAPVCGCDGATYSNGCEAFSLGVNVDYTGVCIVTCNEAGDCGEQQYCAQTGCDVMGTCETRPASCPDTYDPVCGCDGLTYANTCQAASAGYSVDYSGGCIIPCYGNGDCTESDYCSLDSCAAETGTCIDRPTTCSDVYDPVCGCNGTTYANSCEAALAGVSVDYSGACSVQ